MICAIHCNLATKKNVIRNIEKHQVRILHSIQHMQDYIQHMSHLFCCLLSPFAICNDMIEVFLDSDAICQVL